MGVAPLAPQRKLVCVTDELTNGMVEFRFAIDDPHLNVELVMPHAAFDEFCRVHSVEFVAPDCMAHGDGCHDFNWNMKEARENRLRRR